MFPHQPRNAVEKVPAWAGRSSALMQASVVSAAGLAENPQARRSVAQQRKVSNRSPLELPAVRGGCPPHRFPHRSRDAESTARLSSLRPSANRAFCRARKASRIVRSQGLKTSGYASRGGHLHCTRDFARPVSLLGNCELKCFMPIASQPKALRLRRIFKHAGVHHCLPLHIRSSCPSWARCWRRELPAFWRPRQADVDDGRWHRRHRRDCVCSAADRPWAYRWRIHARDSSTRGWGSGRVCHAAGTCGVALGHCLEMETRNGDPAEDRGAFIGSVLGCLILFAALVAAHTFL